MKAFGEIDIDPGKVREILSIKENEQIGYRALIQNALYQHVQSATAASYYSPFFIKSPEASRSYWFIHLSQHREARNEIGMIHWAENNTTVHHGGAGLHALGFTPTGDLEQLSMGYIFDQHAKQESRNALLKQLPNIIHESTVTDEAPTLEDIFGKRCNDTPVVREILEEVLTELRDQNELSIVGEGGATSAPDINYRMDRQNSALSAKEFFWALLRSKGEIVLEFGDRLRIPASREKLPSGEVVGSLAITAA